MLDETKPTIGPFLKSLREARGLSLREVEAKTGISNAFFSQIESGKVKRPSPVMLYKLAELFGISYEELMERAGHPVPSGAAPVKRSVETVFRRFGEISEKEEEELLEYLTFLRSRSKKEGRKK